MPSFGVGFNNAAHALSAIQQALDAVQNNIVNASTPGYAAERVRFSAQNFDVTQGLMGGVDVALSSTRDQYLEQSVRTETSALGLAEQQSPMLDTLQQGFNVSGDAGIPGALSSFDSSISALGASPADASLRANVLQAAATLAQAFNQTAARISGVAADAAQQAKATVDQINAIAGHIAELNGKIQSGAQHDAGIQADVNASLDSLSELVNISVGTNPDATATVLIGGQAPLVIGSKSHTVAIQNQPVDVSAPYPKGIAGIQFVDENGMDITGQVSGGKLAAVLQIRNETVPRYLGSQTKLGSLNQLAKGFADQVNAQFTQAQTAAGVQTAPLFVYSPLTDTNAAASLAVNSAITPGQIVPNTGTAALVASTSQNYGLMAGQAGSASAQVATDLQTQQNLTAQAQNQRTGVSGVSLNDQAAQLMSLQQAYQATARIITILNTLSQTTVNLIPQA